ncbi:hypothetical protein HZS61_005298 [Fusarium oxysporum f. sp. conglutinans]|uniref:Uncharacterized protein n=1 Tax=Fusarium oxysporum f. sp. conglutinans TaxID=100902 RepID=A0A8H6GCQ4_FUSOX|nr:hypothetical protein HZS61_005298 [Fusarium oxysporum f. sp. conglutinans]KAG6980418.1 hypothetical protein FocnCong_v009736 [Fusarium oxysporum f. sp. conglutinans]KAI8401738.1 hypothetical protein FOFC_18607 [Fusarium oxysporum]
MTPKLSSARKRGRPSLNGALLSPDYPTQRALHAAQRIHQACGMWPTEFCKGFVPETWGIRLIEGLSALVSLVVAAENVELDEVRHRLKVFATSHPRLDRPRLRKSDIAKVRKWLRRMGIDTKQTRRWNGRADDQVDEDETADSEGTEANSEPVDEIIALGPREDLGEYEDEDKEETEEDPDLTVEEEESAPHERNLWSRNRDIGDIPDDEPMEDTMAANPRSAPATTNGQSRGSPVASSSGSNAAESSARPRRNFQPPSRLVHDTPQGSIRRPEGPDEQVSASSAATTPRAFQSSTQPREPPSSQTMAPLPSASQNAQGAQRSGVQPLKQTASSVPGNPQTPVSLPATIPQGTMRLPQQPGSQGSATAAQNSIQLRAQSAESLPTPQSARQPDQRSSSRPSMAATSSQSSSAPRAQASSQLALSHRTSTTSQASQSSQQQPNHRPSASTNATPQASLYSHLGGSQPSTPRPIAPAGVNKRPAPSSPANTFTSTNSFINQTTASISESLTALSTKRQKTADVQRPSLQVTGSLDWNALLPTGDEFRASLKAASAALEPHIKSFEELLTSINDEHRRLTAVERSLRLKNDEQVKDHKKAQDALKDVEKSMTTEIKLLRDLEDLCNKYPEDNELRTFLDKRKRTVREHEEVYTIVKSQLDKSTAGLSKTDSDVALVAKRIGQLDAEKAEVMKEKMGIDTAAKRLMFMSRFMEPGWQARLAMVEEALGEEVMRSAF